MQEVGLSGAGPSELVGEERRVECKNEPVNRQRTDADTIQHPTNNPKRLLPCYILQLHHTIISTNPTLRLHTKDMPSHRRKFYTHNLNGIDLQKLHKLPKKYKTIIFLTTQFTSFYYLQFLILRPVVYLSHI
jgi:hypothetical protein